MLPQNPDIRKAGAQSMGKAGWCGAAERQLPSTELPLHRAQGWEGLVPQFPAQGQNSLPLPGTAAHLTQLLLFPDAKLHPLLQRAPLGRAAVLEGELLRGTARVPQPGCQRVAVTSAPSLMLVVSRNLQSMRLGSQQTPACGVPENL